jgi:hypothetical protein
MEWIYVLQLENGKYFIDCTDTVQYDIYMHIKGHAAVRTKKHKFVKVTHVFRGHRIDLFKYILLFMDMYGMQAVRGGCFLLENMTAENENTICNILSFKDYSCFFCGLTTHLVNVCPSRLNSWHFSNCVAEFIDAATGLPKNYNLFEHRVGFLTEEEARHNNQMMGLSD